MPFKPYNRHILLQEIDIKEEPEARSTILVPDDYKVKSKPHGVYKVLKVADDCAKVSADIVGGKIVVNHVYGALKG